MPYPSISGLAHEQTVLSAAVTPLLPSLEKRGITQQTLTDYGEKTAAMKDTAAGKGSKVSDQKQFTQSEENAAGALRKKLRNVQDGFKKAFRQGSPQWKEAHIGEKDNGSTPRLLLWTTDITKAWEKYKPALISEGRLVQADIDALNAAAAVLQSTDTYLKERCNETPLGTFGICVLCDSSAFCQRHGFAICVYILLKPCF